MRLQKKLSALLAALYLMIVLPPHGSAVESEPARSLQAYLHDEIWQGVSTFSLNLRDYGATAEDLDTARQTLNQRPDMFILEGWRWEYFGSAYKITPSYNPEILAEYDDAKALYSREIRRIAAEASPAWSDLEQVLFVNDYLALHYQYHEKGTNGDAYRFLRDQEGTCNAYTMTVLAVLESLGIPCSWVRSESLNHIWNLVQVGGEWYHLDVTWDDPELAAWDGSRMENPGHVGHTYFLLSTEALRQANGGEHLARDDWEYGVPVQCTSRQYEQAVFHDAVSPFVPWEGLWYYVGEQGLFAWNGRTGAVELRLSFPDWFRSRYPYTRFSGYVADAGLYCVGDTLYFNTSFNLLSYNLFTGAVEVLRDHVQEGKSNIVSLALHGHSLIYQVREGSSLAYYSVGLPETALLPDDTQGSAENAYSADGGGSDSGAQADSGGSDSGAQADSGGSDSGAQADSGGSDSGTPSDGGGSGSGTPSDGSGSDSGTQTDGDGSDSGTPSDGDGSGDGADGNGAAQEGTGTSSLSELIREAKEAWSRLSTGREDLQELLSHALEEAWLWAGEHGVGPRSLLITAAVLLLLALLLGRFKR